MPSKNRKSLNTNVDKVKAKADDQVRLMQGHYLSSKKMADLGPHSAFNLFSLDASDLQVLENIEHGVSGSAADVIARKEALENTLKNEAYAYNVIKKQFDNIKSKIKRAKKEMNLDLLDEAEKLLNEVHGTRQEIITEKDKISRDIHNAIKHLEI